MDRLTSMGISNGAQNFLEAAKALRSGLGKDYTLTPIYFIVCQSIELTAKAFLRGSGYKEAQLKKIGHDLVKCITAAQKLGLGDYCELSCNEEDAIFNINKYYQGKDLQYSISGFKSYPDIEFLIKFGNRLWDSTRKFCEDHRTFHEGKISAVE